jgi:hypothetical protein
VSSRAAEHSEEVCKDASPPPPPSRRVEPVTVSVAQARSSKRTNLTARLYCSRSGRWSHRIIFDRSIDRVRISHLQQQRATRMRARLSHSQSATTIRRRRQKVSAWRLPQLLSANESCSLTFSITGSLEFPARRGQTRLAFVSRPCRRSTPHTSLSRIQGHTAARPGRRRRPAVMVCEQASRSPQLRAGTPSAAAATSQPLRFRRRKPSTSEHLKPQQQRQRQQQQKDTGQSALSVRQKASATARRS